MAVNKSVNIIHQRMFQCDAGSEFMSMTYSFLAVDVKELWFSETLYLCVFAVTPSVTLLTSVPNVGLCVSVVKLLVEHHGKHQ